MERFQPAAPFMKVDSSWVNSATAATSRPRLRFGTSNVIERRRAISRRPIFGDERLWHKSASVPLSQFSAQRCIVEAIPRGSAKIEFIEMMDEATVRVVGPEGDAPVIRLHKREHRRSRKIFEGIGASQELVLQRRRQSYVDCITAAELHLTFLTHFD